MRRKSVLRIAVVVIVVLVAVGISAGVYDATTRGSSSTNGNKPHVVVPFLTVSGNQLVNSTGKPTRLVGVNIGASQYYCLGKYGVPFPTPIDGASVAALQSWHVNAVRILLDEYCWLGVDGEPRSMSVANYRKDIETFVSLLNAAHIEVVLAMTAATGSTAQSSIPGGGSKKTAPMAQAATAPGFWGSVASTFRYSPGMIFDLFGEPQMISWTCWSKGCTVGGTKVAGMQQLVDIVRATGARQPLMLGGVDWSNNLIAWLANEPKDPDKQLIASVHVYQKDHCNNVKCWNATIAPVTKKVPVVSGEFGDENCSTRFTKRFMKWSDAHSVSYLAWSWLVGNTCSDGGTLISSYSGTPSTYGTVIKDQVAAVSATGVTDLDPA